jgi:hypothetical protein
MTGSRKREAVRLVLILLLFILAGSGVTAGGGTGGGSGWDFLFSVEEAEHDEPLLKPGAIAVDTIRNEVYISDRGRRQVIVYDQEGRYLHKLRLDRTLRIPFKLAVAGNGTLVIGEQDMPRIWSVGRDQVGMEPIDLKSSSRGRFSPGGMGFDSGGRLLVAGRFGRDVMRLDMDSRNTGLFYTFPKEENEGVALQDVVQGARGGETILISSRGYAVHVIGRDGRLVNHFGLHGSSAGKFSFPIAGAVGPRGKLWIVDTFQHAVKVYSEDGTFVKEYGEMGTEPGKLFFPLDIAFGSRGRLFILEKGIARFQAFKVPVTDRPNNKQ